MHFKASVLTVNTYIFSTKTTDIILQFLGLSMTVQNVALGILRQQLHANM